MAFQLNGTGPVIENEGLYVVAVNPVGPIELNRTAAGFTPVTVAVIIGVVLKSVDPKFTAPVPPALVVPVPPSCLRLGGS